MSVSTLLVLSILCGSMIFTSVLIGLNIWVGKKLNKINEELRNARMEKEETKE